MEGGGFALIRPCYYVIRARGLIIPGIFVGGASDFRPPPAQLARPRNAVDRVRLFSTEIDERRFIDTKTEII